jgi:flagellar motility protein MotE (MotC chaperone)
MISEDKYELIDYNSELKLIRSKEDDVFRVQSIMLCLGYDEKKYKHVDHYLQIDGTRELIAEIMVDKNLTEDKIHEARNDIKKDRRGTYIHRLLINHFACWYCPRYCYKIQVILDDLMKAEGEQLKKEKLELEQRIEAVEVEKKAVAEEVEELTGEISDKSVRTDICDKKLKIIEPEDFYYVSGDQDYSKFERFGGKIKYVFWFPASINVRQAVRRDFKKGDIAPVLNLKRNRNLK